MDMYVKYLPFIHCVRPPSLASALADTMDYICSVRRNTDDNITINGNIVIY